MRGVITTRFTELFDLQYPIMSAPMALHSGGTLAAAVSEAGGLGSFGCLGLGGADWLRDEIARVQKQTSRPFAVGYITPFLSFMTELFDIALESGVRVIALSFAPVQPWLSRAHDAGAKVIAQVQSFELLHDALDAGADGIAIQGNEAGGHTGPLGLIPFLTQALDIVDGRVPVLAAGGIANARALAAVIAAGADGAWIGTPFLATPEAVEVPDGYKQLVVDSDGQDTVFGTLFDRIGGAPWPEPVGVRMRRNQFLREWEGRDAEAIARREELVAQWVPQGQPFDPERTPVFYGPGAASVSAIRLAGDIVRSLAEEAERLLSQRGRV